MIELSNEQLSVLKLYADTDDARFMQGVPGASALWRPLGLLDWRGTQYGSHFYSITDKGRLALQAPLTPHGE